MSEYYMGYHIDDTEMFQLVTFEDELDADLNALEWVRIDADDEEEARDKYERAFFDWQVSQGLAKPGDWEDVSVEEPAYAGV